MPRLNIVMIQIVIVSLCGLAMMTAMPRLAVRRLIARVVNTAISVVAAIVEPASLVIMIWTPRLAVHR
jgi:uncharacterized membrane protein YhaH (DUF805 family)